MTPCNIGSIQRVSVYGRYVWVRSTLRTRQRVKLWRVTVSIRQGCARYDCLTVKSTML